MSRLSRPTSPLVENYDYFYNDLTKYLNNELKLYHDLNDKIGNRESVENVIDTLHSILALGKLRTHYILLIHEYENSNLNSFLDKNKSDKLKESKDKITELRNLLMNSQNNEHGRYSDEERYDEVDKIIKQLIKSLSKNVEYIHKVFHLNQEKLRLNNSLVDSFNEIEYLKEEEKNLNTTLLLEPNNEEAIYMLIQINLDKSNFSKANELLTKLDIVCKDFCSKKKEIKKSLQNLEAKNEKKQ